MIKRHIVTFLLAALLFAHALAATLTRNPTSNTTPDPGQGGSAVSSATNTGHGSTTPSCGGESCTDNRTCIWTSFQSVSGQIISITLKIDHSSTGALSGVTAANSFTLSYSLNGGGAWTDAVARTNFTTLSTATFSVALSANQDLTQVKVRDTIVASTNAVGHTASATASVSNILLEVLTQDGTVIVMM